MRFSYNQYAEARTIRPDIARLCEALGISLRELAFGKTHTPEIALRVGDTTVQLEIKRVNAVAAARRGAIIDMIATALTEADGGMEVERLTPQSLQAEEEETPVPRPENASEIASLSHTVDNLYDMLSPLCGVVVQVQQWLARLERKLTKPASKPPQRKGG